MLLYLNMLDISPYFFSGLLLLKKKQCCLYFLITVTAVLILRTCTTMRMNKYKEKSIIVFLCQQKYKRKNTIALAKSKRIASCILMLLLSHEMCSIFTTTNENNKILHTLSFTSLDLLLIVFSI